MTTIRKILCPTDFSPTARKATDLGLEMAQRFGAELVLLHVLPDLTYPIRSLGTVAAFPNLHEELHKRANEELREYAALLHTTVPVTLELRDGPPHVGVLHCAAELNCDLIVIGTHGYHGVKHMLLGSTAEKVVRAAGCPVLTVRG